MASTNMDGFFKMKIFGIDSQPIIFLNEKTVEISSRARGIGLCLVKL